MNRARLCLVPLYLLGVALAVVPHDHGPGATPADHAQARCVDAGPGLAGHESPDLGAPGHGCEACHLRAHSAFWPDRGRVAPVVSAPERPGRALVRVPSRPTLRPSNRAPPHA